MSGDATTSVLVPVERRTLQEVEEALHWAITECDEAAGYANAEDAADLRQRSDRYAELHATVQGLLRESLPEGSAR